MGVCLNKETRIIRNGQENIERKFATAGRSTVWKKPDAEGIFLYDRDVDTLIVSMLDFEPGTYVALPPGGEKPYDGVVGDDLWRTLPEEYQSFLLWGS